MYWNRIWKDFLCKYHCPVWASDYRKKSSCKSKLLSVQDIKYFKILNLRNIVYSLGLQKNTIFFLKEYRYILPPFQCIFIHFLRNLIYLVGFGLFSPLYYWKWCGHILPNIANVGSIPGFARVERATVNYKFLMTCPWYGLGPLQCSGASVTVGSHQW